MANTQNSYRFWLTFSPRKAQESLLREMSQKFPVLFKIRNSGQERNIALLGLELTGERAVIESTLKWFRRKGVHVDPVELSTVEG